MKALKKLVLASVTLAISAALSPCVHSQTGTPQLPSDITEFLSRRASCSEWSKRVMDPEQMAQLEAIYSSLRAQACFDVLNDEHALRQKYAGNPEILASLGAGNYTKVITRLPARIAVPPASDR
jgi:hypothetical protein